MSRIEEEEERESEIRCCSSFAKWSKTCPRSGFGGNSITSKSFRGERGGREGSLTLSRLPDERNRRDGVKLETRQ